MHLCAHSFNLYSQNPQGAAVTVRTCTASTLTTKAAPATGCAGTVPEPCKCVHSRCSTTRWSTHATGQRKCPDANSIVSTFICPTVMKFLIN